MSKLRSSLEHTMRRKLRKKPGGKKAMLAAPWVDTELIENTKLRAQLSKKWRYARKRKEPEEVLKVYRDKYLKQKGRTAILTGQKKSQWEESKITEFCGDSKAFWKMAKELLGRKRRTQKKLISLQKKEKSKKLKCAKKNLYPTGQSRSTRS